MPTVSTPSVTSSRPTHATASGPLLAWRTVDLVTVVMLGVALGVAYWGWAFAYNGLSLALDRVRTARRTARAGRGCSPASSAGSSSAGRAPRCSPSWSRPTWSSSSATSGARRPMIAGFLQGLGIELALALWRYRRFGWAVVALGGVLSAVLEAAYEWHAYFSYWDWAYKLAYLGFFALSAAVVAGVGGWLLVRALAATGALDAFPRRARAPGTTPCLTGRSPAPDDAVVRPAGLRFNGFGWRPAGRTRAVLSGLDLTVAPGERVLLCRAERRRQVDPAAGGRGSARRRRRGRPARARSWSTAPRRLLLQRPGDAVVADRVGRDVAFGPENLGSPPRPHRGPGRRGPRRGRPSRTGRRPPPARCPAARPSGSRWPVRWHCDRACCCSTSRPRCSTRPRPRCCARRCSRSWRPPARRWSWWSTGSGRGSTTSTGWSCWTATGGWCATTHRARHSRPRGRAGGERGLGAGSAGTRPGAAPGGPAGGSGTARRGLAPRRWASASG